MYEILNSLVAGTEAETLDVVTRPIRARAGAVNFQVVIPEGVTATVVLQAKLAPNAPWANVQTFEESTIDAFLSAPYFKVVLESADGIPANPGETVKVLLQYIEDRA